MPAFQVAIVPVTVFRQNCSIIWEPDSRRGAVVDPGGEPGRIMDLVRRHGLTIDVILLTHGHLDHAGGAMALKGLLDAAQGAPVPILGPDERDRDLLERIETDQVVFNMSGLRNARPDRWLVEGEVDARLLREQAQLPILVGEVAEDGRPLPGTAAPAAISCLLAPRQEYLDIRVRYIDPVSRKGV